MSSEGYERTIKIICGKDTRRGKVNLPQDAASIAAYGAIRSAVATLFETSVETLRLKYEDDEGDLCMLTQHTVDDFLSLAPSGTLRLTMEMLAGSSEEKCAGSADETLGSGKGQPATPDVPKNSATSDDSLDQLRISIRTLCEKVGVGELQMGHMFAQSMDATVMHGMLPMVMQFIAVAHPTELSVLQHMQSEEPETLKALILSELRSEIEKKGGSAPSGEAAQGNVAPHNPFDAIIGSFFAGKGMGKGGSDTCHPPGFASEAQGDTQGSARHNPFEQLIGAALAGKGMGKGCGTCPAFAPGANPLDILGALAGKGFGKGCMPEAVPPSSTPCSESVHAASDANSLRSTFDESVDDLVNMGLVGDRQVARELLTKHGDISSVVAILTEG
jgi:hypothetical protein